MEGRYSFQRRTKCPFCEKRLVEGGGRHIHICKSRPLGVPKEEIIFQYCLYNYPRISQKELLLQEYVDNLMSLPDLSKKYGINGGNILFLLNYYNIPSRSVSEGCKQIAAGKIKETCLKKYGTTNVLSKGTPAYDKRNRTVFDRYGVSTVFKLPEIKQKCVDDDTFLSRYGMTRKELLSVRTKEWIDSLTEKEFRDWIESSLLSKQSLLNNTRRISKIEQRVVQSLNRQEIKHIDQFLIYTKEKWYYYDFLLPDYNLILEVNGDLYHANPEIYYPTDMMIYVISEERLAMCVWNGDENKKKFAEVHGYRLKYIWEKELRTVHNFDELDRFVMSRLMEDE